MTGGLLREVQLTLGLTRLECEWLIRAGMIGVSASEQRVTGKTGHGLWQEKVWQRYRFRTLGHLRERSQAFQKAYNTYLKRRLIRQGHSDRCKARLRVLPRGIPLFIPCRSAGCRYG